MSILAFDIGGYSVQLGSFKTPETWDEIKVFIKNCLRSYYTNKRIHTKIMTTPLKEERLRKVN